jgi:D-arabinose 1-dehydrogenase-like Zn-dependent alcohol dehydrogenase
MAREVSIKGVWLEDRKVSLREDLPEPRPPVDEALVRISHAGVCSTDHALIGGMYPFTGILGHEFVGFVEAGPANSLARGS